MMSPIPNGSTAAALVIVDELARNGVSDLVIAPGSRSAAVALAAADQLLRVWVEVDERSAGFFALGLARVGRRTAVLTTSGTAAANLFPAVIEADVAMVPLLIITADRPHELRATGANQTIDQVKLFSDRVRWFADVPVAEDRAGEADYWRSVLSRAVSVAHGWNATPGPVHINVAFREPVVPATNDGRVEGTPYRNSVEGRPGGDPWLATSPQANSASELIEVNGRVLVVAGEGAKPGVVEQALSAGCVVVAEGHSGCRIEGTVTTVHHLLASNLIADSLRPDRVVVIGRAGLSPNLAKFVAAADGVGVGQGWFDPARRLTHLYQAVEFVAGRRDQDWVSTWERYEAMARTALDHALDASDVPSEPRTARDVAGMIQPGGSLVVGSSMPVRDLDWFAMAGPPIKVVSNRGASGIDGLVSLALGAAAAGPTLALLGDLSLLHDQNGFLVSPRPDLVMVVVNNDGGGIFSFLPQAGLADFERLFGTPRGLNVGRLAQLHGLGHTLVERASALQTAVIDAQERGGVHLIEVKTNRDENVELHRRLTRLLVEEIEPLVEG